MSVDGACPSPLRESYLSGVGAEEPKTASLPCSEVCPCRCFWEVAVIISCFLPFTNLRLFWGRGRGRPHRRFLQHPNAPGYKGHWEAAFSLHHCSPTSIALLAPPEPLGASLACAVLEPQAGRYPSPRSTHRPAQHTQGVSGFSGESPCWGSGACGDGNALWGCCCRGTPSARVFPGATGHPETLFSLLHCGFPLQHAQNEERTLPALLKGVPSSAPRPCQDTGRCRGYWGRLAKPKGFALRPGHHPLGFSRGGSGGARGNLQEEQLGANHPSSTAALSLALQRDLQAGAELILGWFGAGSRSSLCHGCLCLK